MNHIPESYQIIKTEHIAELDAQAMLLFHKKTGARVAVIENQDENKVFCISFRTPVDNSTGKPHILEHCVLCGSDRYPVKDPFMELAKSSLQTFLNAITFPDKTMYPVASCNAKDMNNLMSVYLDAVFHPLIYKNKNIFLQEGWHYDLESADADLGINGIVYNEMKGAFSDPEEILFRYVQNTLYPDTTYANESGGDPDCIPDLSYQEFLDFHSRYYHPSNSYIYLYGDMDFAERLEYIDREYLSHYDRIDPASQIRLQEPFEAPRSSVIGYGLPEGEDEENKDWICRGWSLPAGMDNTENIAFQVLERALVGVEGAPLKQALIDAGLGEDVFGGLRSELRQPFFYLAAKNTARGDAGRFTAVTKEALDRIAAEGIGEKALLAAINSLEFSSREADFGGFPKGLLYGIGCMDTWLYDEADPFSRLKYEDDYALLKERAGSGWFEELLKKSLIDNPHTVLVELQAKAGLLAEREAILDEKLKKIRQEMSPEETDALIREGEDLLAYQEKEDSPEALATIPKLDLEDLSEGFKKLSAERHEIGAVPVLHHKTFTSGISYVTLSYDVSRVPVSSLFELSLLRSLMGGMDTKGRSYRDLANEIMLVSGGIGMGLSVLNPVEDAENFLPSFDINIKAVRVNLGKALDLAIEMRDATDFSDPKRLTELIRQMRSRYEQNAVMAADTTAISRAFSYFSPSSWYSEQLDGLDYLRWLKALPTGKEELKALSERLAALAKQIFDDSRLTISVTEDAEGFALAKECLAGRFAAVEHLSPVPVGIPELVVRNEGIITPGQVNYAAAGGDLLKAGYSYSGSLNVLRAILSRDYLWNELRVKGGAYGCRCRFSRNGKCFFSSYRDPHIRESYDVYAGIADYLRAFDPDERRMTDYIISVIGTFDRPLTPSMWGAASYSSAMTGLTNEMLEKEREEILATTPEKIRSYAGLVEALMAQHCICTVGCESSLAECGDLFDKVEKLA